MDGEYSTDVLGLAGPNGAGKTTLLKIMAGLIRPSSGRITWSSFGTVLEGEAFRRRMGFCGPYLDLYPDLSCVENLAFIAALRGDGSPDIEASLANAGLREAADQPFGSLSSGQKQRARLASATFFRPEVLFLDEPGSNLDQRGAALIRDLLTSRRSRGWMTVVASNDPEELGQCDDVIRLGGG